ncbi:MAG: Asp23/Gls24 family envelope stress response protein [Oscillospiraceae bacterium]
MEAKKERPVGVIKVSEDVIIKIAEAAAAEVDGVESDGQKLAAEKLGSKLLGAVRVKVSGESAAIRIDIVVREGFNAVNAAEAVQNSVKSAVQNMTGLAVSRVDVRVAGIKFKE